MCIDDSSGIGDILAAVGNERRIAILYELQQAYRHDESSLPYATLKRRVGIRDSGNFNYYLQKLVGRFVFQADDGYALTYAGCKIVSALSAGIFAEQADKRRFDAPGTCYVCGEAALVARYERNVCTSPVERAVRKCSTVRFHRHPLLTVTIASTRSRWGHGDGTHLWLWVRARNVAQK